MTRPRHPLDALARSLFVTALGEDREGELLQALFDGGSATVDAGGQLIIVTAQQLAAIGGDS